MTIEESKDHSSLDTRVDCAGRHENSREFQVRDYLDAAAEAASRTRYVTITLVIAVVIIVSGVMNSLYHSWTGARLLACADPYSDYVTANIGRPPIFAMTRRTSPEYSTAQRLYEVRYRELYSQFMKAYVESGFGVKAPVFGVFVDINDLGVVGGLVFLIILAMYDFCLRRENENLNVAFGHAFNEGHLAQLYDLLAMRQLFTVPRRNAMRETTVTSSFPKTICVIPLVVQTIVVVHDVVTNGAGETLDDAHNSVLLLWEVIFGALLIPVTIWLVVQLGRIDQLWDDWGTIRFGEIATVLPRPTWAARMLGGIPRRHRDQTNRPR